LASAASAYTSPTALTPKPNHRTRALTLPPRALMG
jgi:hypothetical protein